MLHVTRYCFNRIICKSQIFPQRVFFVNKPAVNLFLLSNMASSAGGSSPKFTKEELKRRLTEMQYHVTQEKGTERPFTGEYESNKKKGDYKCVVCGKLLFKSDHKFDSGSGWPSFYKAAADEAVERVVDSTHGMKRVEVVCQNCKAHLGHVFEDGPNPTGERFCMNSASLSFEKH